MAASILSAIVSCAILATSDAFLNPAASAKAQTFSDLECPLIKKYVHRSGQIYAVCINRSEFGALISATLMLVPNFLYQQANAAMMEQPKEKFFEIGVTLNADMAKARFQDARRTIEDLVNNYDSIIRDGGDNVRRYLGTVGTTSAMYGIEKV